MEILSGKSVIQVREKCFRSPKLGARSPPLDLNLGHLYKYVNVLSVQCVHSECGPSANDF